jgi:hypothetical protein
MKRVFAAALLIGAGVLAMACGSNSSLPDDVVDMPTPLTTVVRGQGGADPLPSIDITSPKQGDMVKNGSVTLKVAVEDFKLVDKIGKTSQIGEGHILYTLDPNQPGDPDTGRRVKETADREVKWENITSGEHTLVAQLVENNGSFIEPAVIQRITVNVP